MVDKRDRGRGGWIPSTQLTITTIHSNAVINLIAVRASKTNNTLCAVSSLEVLSTQHSSTQNHSYESVYSRVVLSLSFLSYCQVVVYEYCIHKIICITGVPVLYLNVDLYPLKLNNYAQPLIHDINITNTLLIKISFSSPISYTIIIIIGIY